VAEKLSPIEIVRFEELLTSNTIEQELLINLLEKKGIITKAELLDGIRDLRKNQER
jgi:hypothetical protein